MSLISALETELKQLAQRAEAIKEHLHLRRTLDNALDDLEAEARKLGGDVKEAVRKGVAGIRAEVQRLLDDSDPMPQEGGTSVESSTVPVPPQGAEPIDTTPAAVEPPKAKK